MQEKTKFLYGCAVVGIGDFIFKSNVLREIVGASELVKCVETLFDGENERENLREFRRALGLDGGAKIEFVYCAAGNLRLVFESRADVALVARKLPQYVAQRACGAHFVQAVVEFADGAGVVNGSASAGVINNGSVGAKNAGDAANGENGKNGAKNPPHGYSAAVQELERRLKIQRNNPTLPQNFGVAFLKNNPKTALPCVSLRHENAKPQGTKKREKLDEASLKKLLAADGVKNSLRGEQDVSQQAQNLGDFANDKGKIALIYADGNGLGKLVLGASRAQMHAFSPALDTATKAAFKAACERVFANAWGREHKGVFDKHNKLKLREIICGGDDLVVVCSADIALPLAEAFLDEFEKKSKDAYKAYKGAGGRDAWLDAKSSATNSNLTANGTKNADAPSGKNGETRAPDNLTACAGVVFFNKKFPVHYALTLAKKLCSEAKKHSKGEKSAKNGDNAAATNNKSAKNSDNAAATSNANAVAPTAQTKTAPNAATAPKTNDAPPSSLMFHNIQSSNVTSFEDIVKNELTLNRHDEKERQTRCDFGAYFLRENVRIGGETKPTIAAFLALARRLSEADSPATRLRSYLTLLDTSPKHAQQDLERIWEVYNDGEKAAKYSELFPKLFKELSPTNLVIKRDGVDKTPVFDLISFISNAKVF